MWKRTWLALWIVGNACDLLTTVLLIARVGIWVEFNPFVAPIYSRWGPLGLSVYKGLFTGGIPTILYLPAFRQRWLLVVFPLAVWIAAVGNLVILFISG